MNYIVWKRIKERRKEWNLQFTPENLGSNLKKKENSRKKKGSFYYCINQISVTTSSAGYDRNGLKCALAVMQGESFEAFTCHVPGLRVNYKITQSMVKAIGFPGEIYCLEISQW